MKKKTNSEKKMTKKHFQKQVNVKNGKKCNKKN